VNTLGRLCSNLRHLDLEDYYGQDHEYYNLVSADVEVLLSGCSATLVSLALCPFADALEEEQSLFVHCTRLEKLVVKHGPNAEDMKTIGRLGCLKELTIASRRDVTDKEFEKTFEQLVSLQHLRLDGCLKLGHKAVKALLKNCTNLKSLSCKDIVEIEGLGEAVAHCGRQAIHLHKLHLSLCVLNRNDIMAVASLSNLRELHINEASEKEFMLSKQDYRNAFQQPGSLVSLEVLCLSRCNNLGRDSPIVKHYS
jgi:hypothetical protein